MGLTLNITNEYDELTQGIVGTTEGYHRIPSLVSVMNGIQQRTFERSGHPTEEQLLPEFAAFPTVMESAGARVNQPILAPDSVQDQTCPRDSGFVIGDVFVAAGMCHHGREEESACIGHLLASCVGQALDVLSGVAFEGGTMRSATDGLGLAPLRLEYLARDGGALTAGETRLTPKKPVWAAFQDADTQAFRQPARFGGTQFLARKPAFGS